MTLSTLINEIEKAFICCGVGYKSDHILSHHVPKRYIPGQSPIKIATFNRPKDCLMLCENEICTFCHTKSKQHSYYEKRRKLTLQEPAKPNVPASQTSSKRLLLTMQNYRIQNKELKSQVDQLQRQLENASVPTSPELSKDLTSIMSNADKSKISPFMSFFWEQQQRYIQSSSTGVRYHPAIIRYCLSLLSKSSSAYEDIRYNEKTGTGFLILPSQRRLRDY